MIRKRIVPSIYLTAFAITTLIFIVGILVGNHFSNMKLSKISELESEIKAEALGTELQYLILSEHPCDFMNMTIYTRQLTEMGKKLTFMEDQLGKDNQDVIRLKEQYHLLEIQHWLYSKRWVKECEQEKKMVLFFYTNAKDCADCQDQGHVLNYVHTEYPKFNVYSFEYAIENPALNTLRELYGIEKSRLPAIVIKEKTYYGFQSKDRLLELLNLTEDE